MHSQSQSGFRFFGFLIISSFVLGVALVGCSLYERVTFRAYRLGIGSPPLFTPYYLGRLALIASLALLLIGGLYRLRDPGSALRQHALSDAQRLIAYGLLVMIAACAGLYVVDPALFHRIALEDGPVEWASALIPLAASGAFFHAFCRIWRHAGDAPRGTALVFAGLFAVILFVLGMEEISWMQRVFGVQTPAIFSANEQNETNLHNMHSLFFNVVYRTGVFAGLIVLPFVVEAAPKNRLFERIGDFLPSRFVLAASAPLVGFDYNLWNFFLGPLLLALAVAIFAFYAKAAHDRGNREEMTLFVCLAVFAVVSQAVFLALGADFVPHTWVISEYRELFLALGLGVFTWEVTARLRARYGRHGGPAVMYPTDIGGPRTA